MTDSTQPASADSTAQHPLHEAIRAMRCEIPSYKRMHQFQTHFGTYSEGFNVARSAAAVLVEKREQGQADEVARLKQDCGALWTLISRISEPINKCFRDRTMPFSDFQAAATAWADSISGEAHPDALRDELSRLRTALSWAVGYINCKAVTEGLKRGVNASDDELLGWLDRADAALAAALPAAQATPRTMNGRTAQDAIIETELLLEETFAKLDPDESHDTWLITRITKIREALADRPADDSVPSQATPTALVELVKKWQVARKRVLGSGSTYTKDEWSAYIRTEMILAAADPSRLSPPAAETP